MLEEGLGLMGLEFDTNFRDKIRHHRRSPGCHKTARRTKMKQTRSALIANSMTLVEVRQVYIKELAASIPMGANGCRRTGRALAAGAYPRVQLPKEMVIGWPSDHPAIGGVTITDWKKDKIKFRVMVHHLAYRHASKKEIPPEADVMHLCGNGKAAVKNDPNRGCIEQSHMAVGSHRSNMNAQGCVGTGICQWCNLVTNMCPHTPRCMTGSFLPDDVVLVEVTLKSGVKRTYTHTSSH